jgi:hypothetical protein
MKKIVLLLLIVITFASCESSDTDYIVGNWKVKSVTTDGVTTEVLDFCDGNSSFKFHAGGRFQSLGALTTPEGESCMFDWANKWTKSDDYYFIHEAYPDIEQPVVLGKLTKINQDSMRLEGNQINVSKILVRQ